MNHEQIEFTMTTLRQAYMLYRETQVFKLSPEDNVRLRDLYSEVNGRPLPTCSTCVVEGVLSLVIKAESIQQAQIADDEQKPKNAEGVNSFNGNWDDLTCFQWEMRNGIHLENEAFVNSTRELPKLLTNLYPLKSLPT
jgi:hypothetical protein